MDGCWTDASNRDAHRWKPKIIIAATFVEGSRAPPCYGMILLAGIESESTRSIASESRSNAYACLRSWCASGMECKICLPTMDLFFHALLSTRDIDMLRWHCDLYALLYMLGFNLNAPSMTKSALRCPLCWRGYELAFPLLKHGLWNGSVRIDAHIRKVRLPGRPPGKRFWLILYLLSAITTFIYLFLTFTIHSQNFHLFDLEKGVSIICIDPNIKGFHVFPLIGEEWHI